MNSRSGFTLVELLVIGAIIAILSVGFGAFMFEQTKQLKHSETSGDVKQLSLSVVGAASKPEVVLHTESESIENLPTPNTECVHPCVWDPDMGQCVYLLSINNDHRDGQTSQNCTVPPNLPPGCTNVCTSGGGGHGGTIGGNTGGGSGGGGQSSGNGVAQ